MQFAMTRRSTILAVVAGAAVVGPAALLAGPAQAKTVKLNFTTKPGPGTTGHKVAGTLKGSPFGKGTFKGTLSANFEESTIVYKVKGGTFTMFTPAGKTASDGVAYTGTFKITKGTGKYKGAKGKGKMTGSLATNIYTFKGSMKY